MDWHKGSIPEAIAEVKNQKKVLLVFVEGNDELSKQMVVTYENAEVAKKIKEKQCVALKLTVNSVPYQQFSQIYPVVVIPSSYFIGKNGMPIEIITGSLEPNEFISKIDKIFQLNEENEDTVIHSASQGEKPIQKEEPMESSECDAVQNGVSNQPSTSEVAMDTSSCGQVPQNKEEDDPSLSLEDRVTRAKTLLETRRQTKVLEEQEDSSSPHQKNSLSSLPVDTGRKRIKVEETTVEKQREQERRKVGKAVQHAQQMRQENELKIWAENRAKEKEEERLARERVRQQIAQDRAERAARFQQTKDEQLAAQQEKEKKRIKEEQERAERNAAMRSTIARLQFRLPDGTSVTHQFPADSSLQEARTFVINEIQPSFTNFTLCTTFPRRHFTENDYSQSLRDLQLAPSAAILVLPGAAVTVANRSVGFFDYFFWMMMTPFLAVWRAITSFFHRPRSDPAATAPAEPQPGPSGNQESEVKDGPAAQKPPKQKFYQEGNVFRINNRPTDDDDNSTYNGNSTQQM